MRHKTVAIISAKVYLCHSVKNNEYYGNYI